MIWKMIRSGTLTSNEDGSEALTYLDVEDFGLEVAEVQFVVEILERSSPEVQIRIHQDHGASLNYSGYVTTAADPVRATPVSGNLPATLLGACTLPVPYFRTSIGVSSTAARQDSVTLMLYVGGRRV